MKADREAKEAYPEEMKSVAEHEEVPEEEAAVKPVTALKKWHGDQRLAVACRDQLKKWTQGDGVSQELAATGRGMTCCAIPARHQGPGRDNVAEGTRKDVRLGREVMRNPAATSEKGEDNRQWHQRINQKTSNNWKGWEMLTRTSGRP
jgi:hypothetical protein